MLVRKVRADAICICILFYTCARPVLQTNERALQAAEHEAQLVGIQNKLHSELTSHRSNHNLEVEQIKASHDRTMSELEDELEVTRKQLAAAKAEAEANHVSAENLAREKSLATERVSELTLTLEKARKDREEELRLAHAMRSEAESKHSETTMRHVELGVKHETVSAQLQKHEDTLVAERSAAKAETDDLRSKLESTSRSLESVQSELKRYKGTTTKISREKRIKLRADASAIHRQVGLVREDCNVLRTEVQMKLEMMKNDVLRELGELQWYHKEDIGRVVGSLQSQSRTTKQIYEDKMDRFREQLEEEYAQATERLKTVHQLEKDQLRLDLTAERDEHIGKLKPELLEAQSAHRSALQHREHSERQLEVMQQQHASTKRELDESRLAHTETKLDVASHRSNLGVAEDKLASLQAENAELGQKVEAAAVAEKELSEMRLTLTHVIAALGKRVQLPHGVSESLLARPASAATTGEALAKIDAAMVDLASSSVSDAEKKWEELVATLRAQLETMKGGEDEYKDKVRELEQQLSKACSERDNALAAHSDANHAATEQRRSHEADLQRVRKEAELTAELAKADAITPYKSRIEAMQSHVDELERRTLEQLQDKERTVAEQLSSSVYMHEEALRNSERAHTQRVQEVERDAHAASMQLTRLQATAEEAERRAASSKQELDELRRRLQNESVDATRAKEEAQDKLRTAEAELQAQRSEMGDYRRKVESERKNYKRLLKAQEQKMRDHDRQRAVAEERERQLYNTVREKEGQISSMAEDFQQVRIALRHQNERR
jgi:chromosome segregation ATPase